MGPIVRPETSVNYKSTLRNIPEERGVSHTKAEKPDITLSYLFLIVRYGLRRCSGSSSMPHSIKFFRWWSQGPNSQPIPIYIYIYIYIYRYTHTHIYGPGSSVGIATDYGLDGPGSNPGGDEFFPPVQTCPGDHPASCKMGTGSFPGVKCGRGVLLITHPLPVPRSWKSRAIPLGHTGTVTGKFYLYLYIYIYIYIYIHVYIHIHAYI